MVSIMMRKTSAKNNKLFKPINGKTETKFYKRVFLFCRLLTDLLI